MAFRCILNLSDIFCVFLRQKMSNFPPEVMVWSLLVHVEDVLILEILKHNKILGNNLH